MGSSRGRKSDDWDYLKQPVCSEWHHQCIFINTKAPWLCCHPNVWRMSPHQWQAGERWTREDKLQRAPEWAPDLSTPCVLSIWWIILILRGPGPFSCPWTRMMISILLGHCKDPKRSSKRSGFAGYIMFLESCLCLCSSKRKRPVYPRCFGITQERGRE